MNDALAEQQPMDQQTCLMAFKRFPMRLRGLDWNMSFTIGSSEFDGSWNTTETICMNKLSIISINPCSALVRLRRLLSEPLHEVSS
jgi:hypothetical protein